MPRHTQRHPTRLLALLAALAASACATPAAPPPARTSLPTLGPGDSNARLGYEEPPVQHAADLLPPELREGPHHRVADEVGSDGFMRIYGVRSDYGEFTAYGDQMLRIRVAEIRALGALEELSASEEFAAALGRSLKSPFVATWHLVTNPVESLSGIPRGAADAMRQTSELARGERGEFEASAFAELFGFEQRKRELAQRLGVDPYSSNAVLQRQLNRFTWVAYIGGLGEMVMPFARDEPAPVERISLEERREADLLREFAPEDLRRLNRIELAVMGVPEDTAQAFITHPWYSPRLQSLLVAHLAAMDLVDNRGVLLETALRARSEEDALLYERTAELLLLYHQQVAPFERLAPFADGTVVGVTRDAGLVAAVPLDYAVWTRPVHAYANTLKRTTLSDGRGIERRELLVTGSLSPKARAKFEQRGIGVTERALERLRPAAQPPAEEAGHRL